MKYLIFFLIIITNIYSTKIKLTSLEWPPYSSEKLDNQGSSIYKLKKLLEESGIEVEVEFYPWKRSQHIAGNRGYFGYFPAWPEEVLDGFIMSLPIDTSHISLMKRLDYEVDTNDLDYIFSKYKIGYVETYIYPECIDSLIKQYKSNMEAAPNELTLLRKLASSRVDFAITDPKVMNYIAKEEEIYNIVEAFTIMEKELVIAINELPENERVTTIINSIIEKNSKEFEQINSLCNDN